MCPPVLATAQVIASLHRRAGRHVGRPLRSVGINRWIYCTGEEENQPSDVPLVTLIFKAVAVAMGIAAVVLNILGKVTPQTTGILLGLGLAALAIVELKE